VRAGTENPLIIKTEKTTPYRYPMNTLLMFHNSLVNYFVRIRQDQKFNQLFKFLSAHYKTSKIIVYFLTCKCVNYFHKLLQIASEKMKKKFELIPLHGKMPKTKRKNSLFEFSKASNGILLCTDVASRGLDFPQVDYVIQYDPPVKPVEFIHRIGRTARMDAKGVSLIYIDDHELGYIEEIRKQGVSIKQVKTPENVSDILSKLEEKDLPLIGANAFQTFISTYYQHKAINIPDKETNFTFWKKLIATFHCKGMPELHPSIKLPKNVQEWYFEFLVIIRMTIP
jgi:superfamily II DNA/RNA helicase